MGMEAPRRGLHAHVNVIRLDQAGLDFLPLQTERESLVIHRNVSRATIRVREKPLPLAYSYGDLGVAVVGSPVCWGDLPQRQR